MCGISTCTLREIEAALARYCRIDRGTGQCVWGVGGVRDGYSRYTTINYHIVYRQCRPMRKIRQGVVVVGAWGKLGGEEIQRLGTIKLSDRRK